jgi:hypothetical protein
MVIELYRRLSDPKIQVAGIRKGGMDLLGEWWGKSVLGCFGLVLSGWDFLIICILRCSY